MAAVVYLHWTATGYDWIRPGHYHSIIGGDGRVHRLHAYSVDLPAHTYAWDASLRRILIGARMSLPPTATMPCRLRWVGRWWNSP